MEFQVITSGVKDVACDVLVVGSVRGQGGQVELPGTTATVDNLLNGLLHEISTIEEFKGNLGELAPVHTMGRLAARRVLLVGLGEQGKLTSQSFRRASAVAARQAQSTGARTLCLALNWSGSGIDAEEGAQAEVEGALLGTYSFRKYQHSEQQGSNGMGIAKVELLSYDSQQAQLQEGIRRGVALAEAANFARDLVNEPPNVMTPTELANRAVAMAKRFGLEYQVLDRPQMEELGMGGLLAVSQGSAQPPKFIILRYQGDKSTKRGMALVGKGITFDTGGISLKPPERMDEMKGDMAGAAAVIGAMQAIAALKPPINVTVLVPTTENMPGGNAYRPGDIVRIMNGKTIEIVNTDAEGRMILSDALSYAVREGLSPIIDVATLTGGIVVALGSVMTGLFCNNEQLCQEIIEAGKLAGEKYWPMPLDEEYAEQIKSDIADIKQTGGRPASSVTAAKILENFVASAQWAHLDIAGTFYVESKKPYQEKGATGTATRTLANLALLLAHQQ